MRFSSVIQVALSLGFLVVGVAGIVPKAEASHHRGVDDWASIDALGRVTLHARTRWRHNAFLDPDFAGEVGVSPTRFGASSFTCGYDQTQSYTVPVATGMQIVCRSVGGCGAIAQDAVAYTWPADCDAQTTANNTGYECFGFTQALTTTGQDTSNPTYDQREQVLPIPLGNTAFVSPVQQIVTPRNLPHGDYDIQWVDSSRVVGIQNINPSETCATPQSDNSFGFSVRVRWNGTPNNGPSIDSNAAGFLARGFDFLQNINANDADDDVITYTMPVGDTAAYNFEPNTVAPGLSLNSNTGALTIAAANTQLPIFKDNAFDGASCNNDTDCAAVTPNDIGLRCIGGHCMTGAAYLVKVKINDTNGAISETDLMLQPLATTNKPPTLDPIGDRTLPGGVESCFMISASDDPSDSDGGTIPPASNTFKATPLPALASLGTAFAGGTSQQCPNNGPTFACPNGKVCALFDWTPPPTTQVPFGINFVVTNPGTTGAPWNGMDALTDSEVVRIRVSGNTRAPVLKEIAGQTVGADPAKVQPVVNETVQFNALAQAPNASDSLVYSLPSLTCVSGALCPVAGASRPMSDITTDVPNIIHQGTDGFGRAVGVITLKNPATQGTWTLTVKVTDTDNMLSDQKPVTIVVGTFENHPPQFRIVPPTEIFATIGTAIDFPVEAQDTDVGQTVNITMSGPTGPHFSGNPGTDNRLRIGATCSSTTSPACCTSGTACTIDPLEVGCSQLQPNQPNTCNDLTTNPVCSPSLECQKGHFTWTPQAADAGANGMTYVIHFDAADSVAGANKRTSTAETIIHVAPSTATTTAIYGVVPNHGPPGLLNGLVGTTGCTTGTLNTVCGGGAIPPLGMQCLNTSGGLACVDTSHLVTVYGQGFTGLVSVDLNGTPVRNLNVVSSTQLTFNTPPGTAGSVVNVHVNGATSATLANGFKYACPTQLCASVDDTNFEGSNACAFVNPFPGCTFDDADGDGINATQEAAHYIDVDCDNQNTALDIQLPGSDPNVPDVYVQYDWMATGGAGDLPFANRNHRPMEGCWINPQPGHTPDCANGTFNATPLTACSYQPSLASASDVYIPGSWERVVQSYGAHTTLASSATLSQIADFTITVNSTAGFLPASAYYPLSLKLQNPAVDGGKPQSVVCKGVSGNTYSACRGGVGSMPANSTKVYVGSPTPINLHPLKGKEVTHYWVTTFGPQLPQCTIGSTNPTTPANPAHNTNPWVDFFQMKALDMPRTNGLAYHYALFSHNSNCDGCGSCTPVGSTGCGGATGLRPTDGSCIDSFGGAPLPFATGIASVYGPDVIISLGDNGFSCTEDWIRGEAGTIMHELGHNLGLNHGGYQDTFNHKSNYMSVMNYHYQYSGLNSWPVTGSSSLSYSDGSNDPLDENNLFEANGIPYNPAHNSQYYVTYWDYSAPINNQSYASIGANADVINWNGDNATPNDSEGLACAPGPAVCCDGGDVDCTATGGSTPTDVVCDAGVCKEQVDTNHDGTNDLHKDNLDWGTNLNFKYQCSAAYLPGGAPYCNPTASSSYAQTLIQHCENTSEYSMVQAKADGINLTPPITAVGEPQKECLDASSHGVIPAYLDGKFGLDVTKVVLTSFRLGHAFVNNTSACSFQDHNGDGFTDLKCQFRQDQIGISAGTTHICMTGVTTGGTHFSACFPIQLKNDPLNPCQ